MVKMMCTCRTKSLRVFVQSLTELRVAEPAAITSTRPYHSRPALPFSHTTDRLSARSFSSMPAVYFPRPGYPRKRQRAWQDKLNSILAGEIEVPCKSADGFVPDLDTVLDDLPGVLPPGSEHRLERAKDEGAILDFNPESLNRLMANIKAEERAHEEAEFYGVPRRMDAPPNLTRHKESDHQKDDNERYSILRKPIAPAAEKSQLKRLKIAKDDKPAKPSRPEPHPNVRKEDWQIQKKALKEKFPDGWQPRKRLSPDALDGIRTLHKQYPEQYTTEVLAKHFEISAEAVRRILRSKWVPSAEEETDRSERWFRRGKSIWSNMAELGKKPPRKWREEGIVRDPKWNVKRGERNYWPYDARAKAPDEEDKVVESAQRKFSGRLL
ncbi:hypothetical protein F5Y16DRAFT_385066 [Xylariaceae sp. FL0255]|nr:hypothetical protein F5Y16DRAFT_385066 [Xylariaceae sp. FL0255]